MTTQNDAVLAAEGVSKRYGAQRVLEDIDIEVRAGEILALIGENGAGKSTLMRVLAGVVRPDTGKITFEGKPVYLHSVREAQNLGIAMIYQELNLVPSRTVAQNIFLGREPLLPGPLGKLGVIDRRRLRRDAEGPLRIVGSRALPDMNLAELSVGQQQLVEIAKAISFKAKLLFMDEPTSSLSEEAAANLMTLVRELRAQGMAIVLTTHRLSEALAVADRFIVLRDGALVGRLDADEATEQRIVEMMVGRPIDQLYPKLAAPRGLEPALEVEGLSGGMVESVSFAVYPGEVLGFAGLVGAGRTETARLVFGDEQPTAGTIRFGGKVVKIRSPKEAIALGMGLVPEDRKKDALVPVLSVRENMILAGFGELSKNGILDRARIAKATRGYTDKLSIRFRSLDQTVGGLSGGNQQKCVLSRWLILPTKVLILDEPTRGVDVGAKATIYQLINELALQGVAVILISSDLPEVLGMSDRIVVMAEGKITAIVDRAQATPELIMGYASDGRY